MKIAVGFDSPEEAIPFFQAYFTAPSAAPPKAPENNAQSVPSPTKSEPAPAVETEKPKRTRRAKAETAAEQAPVQAAKVADVDPEDAPTAQSSEFDDAPPEVDFLDDDSVTPAPALSKDDVRAALVEYQERLTKSGVDIEEARTTVLALLKKVSGGADKLGGCPENKFAEVIKAAHNAK